MNKPQLGKKQSISNDDWKEAIENIENVISKEEIELLVAITKAEIEKNIKDKKVAYAWSGGKDSIVLGNICEMVGINACLIGVCDLEYKEFTDWIMENKPTGCSVINTGQDVAWLKKHPEMLFPKDSAIAAKWFSIVQHKAQRKYYKDNQLDMLLLGRRRADGNYVGKKSNIYTDGKGLTRYSPLSEWKHEHILAFIHYYNLPLPPIYDWDNGYKCGTHPWPARQYTESIVNGWNEVINIQPDLVEFKKIMEEL